MEAATARTKARKLIEEKMVMIAHEKGRHHGYKEGLSYGRRLGFDEGGSRPIGYSASSTRRIPQRGVLPDGENEEEEEEEEKSVHSERNNVLLRPRIPPQPQHMCSESAPPVPVPTLVAPPRPSSSQELPRRIRTPSPLTPPEDTAYPIPMRLASSSASGYSMGIPQDG